MEQIVKDINATISSIRNHSKNLKELELNKKYVVVDLKSVKTRYGRSVLMTLHDPIEDITFNCFSTKRISNSLTEEVLEKMKNNEKQLFLIFKGEIKPFANSQITSPLIEFIYDP